ncbi:MAG: hypothetical protein AAFX99_20985 [Myxococcota bacterium]
MNTNLESFLLEQVSTAEVLMPKLLLMMVWSVVLLMGTAHMLCAQERPVVKLSNEHIRQLDQAVGLAEEGQLAEALEIYDRLIEDLDLDLLYLNRGRILQRLGLCQKAREAFDKVATSSRLANTDAALVFVPLEQYTRELEVSCPGRLQITCRQEGMAVTLEGPETRQAQCGEPLTVPPGDWTVTGSLHGQTTQGRATVRGTQTATVSLSLDRQGLVAAGRVLLGQRQFKQAEGLFKEALRIEPTQDTWLYIGESLLGEGQCQLAYASSQEVKDAPPSGVLSPLEVTQRLELFRNAHREACGEPVRLRCVPAEMTIRIDGAPPQFCSPAPVFLSAGLHDITASAIVAEGEPTLTVNRTVMITEGGPNQVNLVLYEDEVLGPVGWYGVLGLGLGAAALTSAVLIDRLLLVPRVENFDQQKRDGATSASLEDELNDIESLKTLNRSLAGGGGALLLIGGALLLTDQVLLEESSPAERVSVVLGPGETWVLWNMTWP